MSLWTAFLHVPGTVASTRRPGSARRQLVMGTSQAFASSCFAPRLSATRLLVVTECQSAIAGNFTTLVRCNYRRTGSGVSPDADRTAFSAEEENNGTVSRASGSNSLTGIRA